MFQFEEPKYFYFLFAVLLLLLLFLYTIFWKNKKIKQFGNEVLVNKLMPNHSIFKSFLKALTVLGALFFMVVALVNPKMGTKVETVKRQGIDIVFALDLSKSMLAEDIAPNRLEKSKQVISQIINQLGNDRIGIIGYAASAYPVLPMTTDYSIAKMYLQNANTNMVSSQGTSLSDAISMATKYFDAVDTNKLIILISDGEDHEENIEDAIALAKQKNINIITIGVGTTSGSTIPIRGSNGGIIDYKKDENGEKVITKLNLETLQKISLSAKGKYIAGNNTKEVVEEIKNQLNKIEKTEFESQQIAQFQSQYQWVLFLAFLLLFIDVFFLERTTVWIEKLNLFNEKSK